MKAQAGFLYVEVLVTTVLVAVCLVPALQSLQASAMVAAQAAGGAQPGLALRAKTEEVVGRAYAVLDFAANRSSSSATVEVSSPRQSGNAGLDPGPGYSDASYLVYIYRFDGTSLTSTDTGLLRVKVVARSNPALFIDTLVAR